MKMSEKKGMSKGLLIGILAGGITAGLAALLYAPKSGRELRTDIINKKNQLIKEAGQYFENAKMNAANLVNAGKRKAEDMLEGAKRKREELYNSVTEKIQDRKAVFQSGANAFI
jgi:gas vesicle protein